MTPRPTFGRWIPIVASTLLASAGAAQTVRGTVVDAGAVPVPGVVVQLLDDSSNVRARALSDERGVFLLVAPTAGSYRVRTLRIGFKPVLSERVTLTGGQESAQRFQLASIPSGLDTVRVGGRSACGKASEAAAATASAWEQVRGAVAATEISASARRIATTRVQYDRTLDAAGFRTLQQRMQLHTELLTQPWTAPTPAALHNAGYIVAFDDSLSYRAPGLDMLGSTTFVDDHCFRLVDGRDKKTLGISFEPAPERRKLGEIRGTVWVDRATSELRGMEFRYAHGTEPDLVEGARGLMDFARLSNGGWAISRWEIRMPVRTRAAATRPGGGADARVVVSAIRVAGGELALAMRGGDTLYARQPLALKGTVVDSSSGRAVASARVSLQGTGQQGMTDRDGRFTISAVLPGEYLLDVATASLDSLNTSSQLPVTITDGVEPVRIRVPSGSLVMERLCGAAFRSGAGILMGAVAAPNADVPPQGTKVVAEWTERPSNALRRAAIPLDDEGRFRLCGVPVGTPIVLTAGADSVSAEPLTLTIAPERPVELAQFYLDQKTGAGALFTGVVTDSAQRPIAGADVMLPGLGRSVTSDARGEFQLRAVQAGTHKLMVRKIGFGPLDASLVFAANEAVSRRVVLASVAALPEVKITAPDRRMEEFETNRALNLGHFMTREFLATQEGRPVGELFGAVPGVRVSSAPGRREAYLASSRRCVYFTAQFKGGPSQQTCKPCYALVFLDGALLNPTGSFDMNTLDVASLEAVEYYSAPATMPARFSIWNSSCGVVSLHSRRSP